MQIVYHLRPWSAWIQDHEKWILDARLLRTLYFKVQLLRAAAARSKRKRQEREAAIVEPKFASVHPFRDENNRGAFYIAYGNDEQCSDTYFRVYSDLTVCTGVPPRVYDGKPLASPRWAKLRRKMRTRAIAMYWLERTSVNAYAEGGTGRERDLASFEAEFA